MKLAAVLVLALAPAWAQLAKPVVVSSAAGAPKVQGVSLASLAFLEKAFDNRLTSYNLNDPIDLLGGTRGLYLDGYGAVFTTELSLIVTPGISPFHQTITEPEKVLVHQRKVARLPALRQLMTDMVKSSAQQLTLVPDNEQVVLAVKLLYLPWERTDGLPGMIVMKASRRAAAAGQIQTESQ